MILHPDVAINRVYGFEDNFIELSRSMRIKAFHVPRKIRGTDRNF